MPPSLKLSIDSANDKPFNLHNKITICKLLLLHYPLACQTIKKLTREEDIQHV